MISHHSFDIYMAVGSRLCVKYLFFVCFSFRIIASHSSFDIIT